MSEPGEEASWSPVPVHPTTAPPAPRSRYGPAASRYGQAYSIADHPQPTTIEPSAIPDSARRRRGPLIALVVGLVVLLGGGTAIAIGIARSAQTFQDAQDRITVRAPRTWEKLKSGTPTDGPITDAERKNGGESADLVISSFLAADNLILYVDTAKPERPSITDTHNAFVDIECYGVKCQRPASPTSTTIAGQPALEETVPLEQQDARGRVLVITTVQSPTLTVRAIGYAVTTDPTPDTTPVVDALHTLQFNR